MHLCSSNDFVSSFTYKIKSENEMDDAKFRIITELERIKNEHSIQDDYKIQLQENNYNIKKPEYLKDWNSMHIMNWLIETYENAGISYDPINMHLLKDFSGHDFIHASIDFFKRIDPIHYEWLHCKVKALVSHSDVSQIYNNQFLASTSRNTEYNNDVEFELSKHKKRGRPRLSTTKVQRKPEHKTGKLWEFIRDMLHNPEYCPSLIKWEDHNEGTFKFVSSDKVAKIWGSKRGNKVMNYEKLSRAMRYYYKGDIFQPVYGKRLVYKFGSNAKGWRTNNPNFESHANMI